MRQTEPVILHGQNPHELPRKNIGTILLENQFAAVTGPDGGLTTVNRRQRHLSISDPDVDYIDIQQHVADQERNNAGTSIRPLMKLQWNLTLIYCQFLNYWYFLSSMQLKNIVSHFTLNTSKLQVKFFDVLAFNTVYLIFGSTHVPPPCPCLGTAESSFKKYVILKCIWQA